jgi:hypothetical protein
MYQNKWLKSRLDWCSFLATENRNLENIHRADFRKRGTNGNNRIIDS